MVIKSRDELIFPNTISPLRFSAIESIFLEFAISVLPFALLRTFCGLAVYGFCGFSGKQKAV